MKHKFITKSGNKKVQVTCKYCKCISIANMEYNRTYILHVLDNKGLETCGRVYYWDSNREIIIATKERMKLLSCSSAHDRIAIMAKKNAT